MQGRLEEESSTNGDNTSRSLIESICGFIFLLSKATSVIVVIVMISSSAAISKVKSCELKTALDSIQLTNDHHACKYATIKEKSASLLGFAISYLVINLIAVPAIVVTQNVLESHKFTLWIWYLFLACSALAFFIASVIMFNEVVNKKEEEAIFDYLQLNANMLSWLENNFKTDDVSSNDVSGAWNKFFIMYDCCAVNEVIGTNNDFDNTPWCTTSGSCQDTASQIPKTCCIGVTLTNYQNALSSCYAAVNNGTFKQSCSSKMKNLSRENIPESKVAMLDVPLLFMVILEVVQCISTVICMIQDLRSRRNL